MNAPQGDGMGVIARRKLIGDVADLIYEGFPRLPVDSRNDLDPLAERVVDLVSANLPGAVSLERIAAVIRAARARRRSDLADSEIAWIAAAVAAHLGGQ